MFESTPRLGEWTGLSVGALLLAADTPPETTHVQVEGADGLTVCVPVGAALDGVLTFDDERPTAATSSGFFAGGSRPRCGRPRPPTKKSYM